MGADGLFDGGDDSLGFGVSLDSAGLLLLVGVGVGVDVGVSLDFGVSLDSAGRLLSGGVADVAGVGEVVSPGFCDSSDTFGGLLSGGVADGAGEDADADGSPGREVSPGVDGGLLFAGCAGVGVSVLPGSDVSSGVVV